MPPLRRTWPYGTRRTAELLEVLRRPGVTALVLRDGLGEHHTLIMPARGPHAPAAGLARGRTGQLVFTAGGPTGGYWNFEPDPQAAGTPAAAG